MEPGEGFTCHGHGGLKASSPSLQLAEALDHFPR